MAQPLCFRISSHVATGIVNASPHTLQAPSAQAEGNGLRSARTCCNCTGIQLVLRPLRLTCLFRTAPSRDSRSAAATKTLGSSHHRAIHALAVQIEMYERQQRELQPSSSEIGKRLDLVNLVETGQQCRRHQHWHGPAVHVADDPVQNFSITPTLSKSIVRLTSR